MFSSIFFTVNLINKVVFYSKNGSTYTIDTTVLPSISGSIDFGSTIALTPDMAIMVVGAEDNNSAQGAVFVFK